MNTEYAYHNEVTKASGITKNVSTVLKVFGNLSAGAGAATYKHLINDPNLHTNLIALGAGYLGGVFLIKSG